VNCRHCGAALELTLVDLGSAPPSNAYLTAQKLKQPEKSFPLRVLVCERCWLAQTEGFAQADELFDADYAYFSGYSSTWLAHIERFVHAMIPRFDLDANSHVVEVGANDGSLLQIVKAEGIPCIGIEPTASTANAARAKGIPVVEAFFGARLGRELASTARADLIVANNVLAHVPDINDFVAGFVELLQPNGVATFEFPHLLRLVDESQVDTIYHEHFSYLSLTAANRIFAANGLSVFDVEELPTHGGSLRVFAQRSETGRHPRERRVDVLLACETNAGMTTPAFYDGFQAKAERVKNDFLRFLLDANDRGKSAVAYGAAAKGNTLMNFAGVRPDLVRFVVDANPAKQGKFMPGSRIPIVAEERLRRDRPEYVIILPWNLRAEVTKKIGYITDWDGRFVTAVPRLEVRA
jgi:2-polyprenyl-3-methyl-5-hydroxy-6-metoxy-1,4-benzoquinol methylase